MREPSAFDSILDSAVQQQERMDLDAVVVPRQHRPPRHLTGPACNHVAESINDYYRPICFGLLDNAVSQLIERFAGNGLIKDGRLPEYGYEHGVVNHDREFVNSEDTSVHIQNIESHKWWTKEAVKFLQRKHTFVSGLKESNNVCVLCFDTHCVYQ